MRLDIHIQKTFVQFLLCVYVFALIRPIAPAVTDFLAHHFWESEHISTVHYENGKYHLHIELAKEADESKTNKATPGSSCTDEFLASHLNSEKLIFQAYACNATLIPSPGVHQPIDSVIQAVIPPPEA